MELMIKVEKSDSALGAKISGFDLSKPFSDEDVSNFVQAISENEVVFIRDQNIFRDPRIFGKVRNFQMEIHGNAFLIFEVLKLLNMFCNQNGNIWGQSVFLHFMFWDLRGHFKYDI